MFFVLSKLFGIVVSSPVFYIVALLLVAIWTKRKKYKIVCTVLASLLLLLGSNQFVFNAALKSWSASFAKEYEKDKKYRYGIVLGGFAKYDKTRDRFEFNDAADRWIDAIQLYKQGMIQKIVIASDGSIASANYAGNPRLMINYLSRMGVDSTDVILETHALNTRENATLTLPLLGKEVAGQECLLITSASHMKRAVNCFKKEGLTPDTYIVDIEVDVKYNWINWIPNMSLLYKWQMLIHEWIGFVVYEIMGY